MRIRWDAWESEDLWRWLLNLCAEVLTGVLFPLGFVKDMVLESKDIPFHDR